MYGCYQDLYCWLMFSHPAEVQHLHVFFFSVHPYWACCSSGLYWEVIFDKQDRSPATPVTPKQLLLSVSLSDRVVACSGRSGLWRLLTNADTHRAGPLRKDYLTPSFPSLRKKAHTQLWLISLLKQYGSDETSHCFSGVFGVLTKTIPMYSISSQFRAEELSVAVRTRTMTRADTALMPYYWNILLCDSLTGSHLYTWQSSPAKPLVICIYFSSTNWENSDC